MKKLLFILLLAPFIVNAQINGIIQKTSATGIVRGNFSTIGIDTIPLLQFNSLSNLDMLRYNSATKKFIPRTPSQVLTDIGGVGLSTFSATNPISYDNVTGIFSIANAAIANAKLTNSTISGVSLGSNLNSLSAGTGLTFSGYNGSAAITAKADTTVLQTVLNFFPKGDTRYLKTSAASTIYAPIASPTFTGTVTIPTGSVLGTPTTLVGTNITGTATALNIGGNSATTTLAANSTLWGGASYGGPYLPLAGGTLSGLFTLDNALALQASFNSTNASGGYIKFSRSGTNIGFMGNAAQLLTGVNTEFEVRANTTLNLTAPTDVKIYSRDILAATFGASQALTLTGTFGINGVADNVKGSTYTPTVTAGSNVSSVTARLCHYTRIGNEVTVTGVFNFSPTGAGGGSVNISLPIASNLSVVYDLSGPVSENNASVSDTYIYGDTVNDRAVMDFTSSGSTSASAWFTFTYTVI